VPDGSGTPLEAYAEMRWFRSNARFGSRLALLALAIQFLLSFGHFHGGAKAASINTIGFTAGHLRALGNLSHANASGPVRLNSSGDRPGGQPDDDCAICAVMALANTLVEATPPCLPSPQAVALHHLAADAAFVDPNPARGAFQPRAPPIG
jgi:hypothetical protein